MLVLLKSNSYHFQRLSTTQAWKLKKLNTKESLNSVNVGFAVK